jgi:hypothetical protein
VTCKGPVELEPAVVKIEDDTFTATFDTTAALTGEYVVKADDGDGHTDEVEVFITGKTAQEIAAAVEAAAEKVEEVIEEQHLCLHQSQHQHQHLSRHRNHQVSRRYLQLQAC